MLVGLGHQSRVGKDTVGAFLEARGFERLAFASELKRAALRLFARHGLHSESYYEEHPREREKVLPKLGRTPVELWIEFGQAMREICPTVWLDQALAHWEPELNTVITDVRFPNEAEAIRARGGLLIKIVRPGAPVNGSDECIPEDFPWDAVVENTGTEEELFRKVEEVLGL